MFSILDPCPGKRIVKRDIVQVFFVTPDHTITCGGPVWPVGDVYRQNTAGEANYIGLVFFGPDRFLGHSGARDDRIGVTAFASLEIMSFSSGDFDSDRRRNRGKVYLFLGFSGWAWHVIRPSVAVFLGLARIGRRVFDICRRLLRRRLEIGLARVRRGLELRPRCMR